MISAHAASEHGVHAAVLLMPVLYLVAVVLRERRRGVARPGRRWLHVVAWGTGVAAVVHAAVGLSHRSDSDHDAVFFLTAAAVQSALLVAVLRRPGSRTLLASAVTNLVLLALWTLSRSIGVPVGAAREPVGAADGLVAASEAAAVVAVVVLLVRRQRRSVVVDAAAVQLEPHRLPGARAVGPPAVGERLHDGEPAPGLTVAR